jgi:hypothetical protein
MNTLVLAQTKPSTTSAPPARSNLLERKCAYNGTTSPTGEREERRNRREQQKIRNPQSAIRHDSTIPPVVHEALRSPGQPLDAATREFMEPRFGHDFSQVRVHTDARAAVSAHDVDAHAYTVGHDIVFAAGQYAPATARGQHLLTHELVHVIQQTAHLAQTETSAPTFFRVASDRASKAEAEADRAAATVKNGQLLTTGLSRLGPALQRQEVREEERRRWMDTGRQPAYQLHLDPQIEAQAMVFRLRELLNPDMIRLSLSQIDLDSIIGYQPPPWLAAPRVPESRPLVPRGVGPETSGPGTPGHVVNALMGTTPAQTALTTLQTQVTDRLLRDWRSLSTGGRAAVITQSVIIGGAALAGVLTNPQIRNFVLGQLQDRTLPTGVPGLDVEFNLTGPERRIMFHLDIGALLPSRLGFH